MKTHQLIYTAILLCLLTTFSVQAQNPDSTTLLWSSSKATNQFDQKQKDHVSAFRTIPGQAVEWIQKDGESTYRYAITGKEGQWSSVDSDGTIKYLIALSNVTGEVILTRQNGVITIRLRTSTNGSFDLDYVFDVTSVEQQ